MADSTQASRSIRVVGEYVIGEQIGSGTYSVVWLGRHLSSGTIVAVKEIAVEKLSRKLRDSLLSEVDILRRIRHPNIIALHDFIQADGKIYLILEYCRGGDLSVYVQKRGKVSEAVAKHFMQQLASGLKVLRDNNVVHRDLKPQNILLVEKKETSPLKIADFGFAKFLQPSSLAETLCGSPLYMAPEVMQGQKYDAKADLWSVGIILYQLVTGSTPFNGNNQIQLLQNILKSTEVQFPLGYKLSHDCMDFCKKLLRRNPVERLTFEEFVNHKFLLEHVLDGTSRYTSWTSSNTKDGLPFTDSPRSPSGQIYNEDCMPFPLDDESSGHDESPSVPLSKSAIRSYGFPMGNRVDKTPPGHSPSKNTGLFSRYILGNKSGTTSQRHDYPSRSIKEPKITTGQDPKISANEDSPIIDSLEFVDQEYVFVPGPPREASSSSINAFRPRTSSKSSNAASPSPSALSAPMPINAVAISREQSIGSSGSHSSPVSGTSQGSVDMGDAMDQPSSHYLVRIRSLEEYASAISDVVKEEIKKDRQLDAFSVQLVILAIWKQAMQIYHAHSTSASGVSLSSEMKAKDKSRDASPLLTTSQLPDDVCMHVERKFLGEVAYAEELAVSVGKIAEATEMQDAIETIFQSALQLGRDGGVSEMMGHSAVAVSQYAKAICILRFLLVEASSLALNPPFSLTKSDHLRLRSYIEAINSRLGQLQYNNRQ